jgi:hypothetical protein
VEISLWVFDWLHAFDFNLVLLRVSKQDSGSVSIQRV